MAEKYIVRLLDEKQMKAIVSPLRLGDLRATSLKEMLISSKWQRYKDSLRKQLAERGPIPDAAWGTPDRLAVARKIEAILNEICWGEHFRFAPEDPYSIIGEFEIGDLSEVEAVMAVEEEFGIKILWDKLNAETGGNPNFGQFVDHVVELASNKDRQATAFRWSYSVFQEQRKKVSMT